MTLSQIDALRADVREQDAAFHMDEDTFRVFYERTARGLCAYLARLTGDRQAAADLLQESYYRFLRADAPFESDAHQRNYLYRIATNLVRDRRRRPIVDHVSIDDEHGPQLAVEAGTAERLERRRDLSRAMAGLRQRDRELLWLAYAQGSSHQEIAAALGLKTGSIKLLLFRARRRLADLLRAREGGLTQEHGR
jgi:RNA polymerase sigma-70 factor (ECF subfamily)